VARELRGAMAALFTCTDREVMVEGRAGTAKTTGILTKILHRCERFPGSRHLIVRAHRSDLTNSVLVTLERLMGAEHPEVLRMSRQNRHSYRWGRADIELGGLDEPGKMFSTEYDTIYMAEATEIPTVDPWELFGRAMRNNKCDYHQRIADCNPGPPSHWLNKRSTPASDVLRDSWKTREAYNRLQHFNHHQPRDPAAHPMRRLVSVHPDNPGYWDAGRWDWTPQGRTFLEELQSMTGHRRSRMLDGRWKVAEGAVYPEFDESRHVIDPITPPADWPVYVGWDPGYDHPSAILWFAVAPNGCLYFFDEIYQGGMGVSEYCALVRRRNAGRTVRAYYADPQQAFRHTADSPRSIAEQAADCGIHMTPWPRSTDVDAMVNAVRERLKRVDPESGLPAPGLKVCRNCANTINEFQSWKFKRNAKGEQLSGDDQYEDKLNDAMDVVKGVCSITFGTGEERVEVHG
jgi:hypothetical protein